MISNYFPQPTAARYVWDRNAGEFDTIYLRYRIGGESKNCGYGSRIYFTGDDSAELYVNGELKDSISDWTKYTSIFVNLELGDVVALKVKDNGGGWGAIAAIETHGRGWQSTGSDDWRATKAFVLNGDVNLWMRPEYSACRWQKPVLPQAVGSTGKAADFPYKQTGAKYVWASNAGQSDEIFLRTVVGSQC